MSTRLRWLDNPDLPGDLVLHRRAVQASTLIDHHGQPWAQLITSSGLIAVREGDHRAGDVTLDGCLGFDAYLVEPTPPDWEPEPGTMQILSPEQYFQMFRDRLPAEQWQARGFLVDLDVGDTFL